MDTRNTQRTAGAPAGAAGDAGNQNAAQVAAADAGNPPQDGILPQARSAVPPDVLLAIKELIQKPLSISLKPHDYLSGVQRIQTLSERAGGNIRPQTMFVHSDLEAFRLFPNRYSKDWNDLSNSEFFVVIKDFYSFQTEPEALEYMRAVFINNLDMVSIAQFISRWIVLFDRCGLVTLTPSAVVEIFVAPILPLDFLLAGAITGAGRFASGAPGSGANHVIQVCLSALTEFCKEACYRFSATKFQVNSAAPQSRPSYKNAARGGGGQQDQQSHQGQQAHRNPGQQGRGTPAGSASNPSAQTPAGPSSGATPTAGAASTAGAQPQPPKAPAVAQNQCRKCLGFGHREKDCPSPQQQRN